MRKKYYQIQKSNLKTPLNTKNMPKNTIKCGNHTKKHH